MAGTAHSNSLKNHTLRGKNLRSAATDMRQQMQEVRRQETSSYSPRSACSGQLNIERLWRSHQKLKTLAYTLSTTPLHLSPLCKWRNKHSLRPGLWNLHPEISLKSSLELQAILDSNHLITGWIRKIIITAAMTMWVMQCSQACVDTPGRG